MKSIKYIAVLLSAVIAFTACEKKDYPAGVPELEHQYYVLFVPNNNTAVSLTKNQGIVKFPVQFYSTFSRSYDAVAKYVVVPDATAPAVIGKDYDIVNKNGTVIQPGTDGSFSIVFPKAEQAKDTIYMKLLNNPATGTRKLELQLKENKNEQFYVDIFSTAYRRPLDIK
jgi:hypothetical protein